jgi:hypothetical protein
VRILLRLFLGLALRRLLLLFLGRLGLILHGVYSG